MVRMTSRFRLREGAAIAAMIFAAAAAARAEQKSREQRIADKEIYYNTGDEPPSMDISKQVDSISSFWLGHIYEGLTTYDKNGNVVPAAAESVKSSPDKKTWTFVLRKGTKWQDGQPLKAQDFVFSFQRLVDPAYASEYAFIATVAGLENAEDIIAKKAGKEKLGVRAVDDRTLEMKLSRPVPFFDSLMAFQSFYPLRQDLVQKYGDKFATVPESIVGNGPYKLVVWAKEQSMRIEKADTYWNAAAIKIKAIQMPAIVKDEQANFNNFQTGGIDLSGTRTPELLKQAQAAKLKVETFNTGCLWYLESNTRTGRPFANEDLRRALSAGINRAEFVNKIIGTPGTKPLFGSIPDYLPGSKAGSTYRKESPVTSKDADIAQAKKHLDAYLKEAKQEKVPGFTFLSDDSSRAKKYAEYWQNALAKLFNTQVKVETVPFKTRLQKLRDGQFDLALFGWCPDYRDPMTFADLWTTKNDNNNSGWSNKAYDDLIEKAANEADPAQRVKAFADAEKVLLDGGPIAPVEQDATAYVVAPGLKGVKRRIFGFDPDFRYAEWDAKTATH